MGASSMSATHLNYRLSQLGFLAASRARTRFQLKASFVSAGSSLFAERFDFECINNKQNTVDLLRCSYIKIISPKNIQHSSAKQFSVYLIVSTARRTTATSMPPAQSGPRPKCFNKGSKSCKTSGVFWSQSLGAMDGQETMI